jgi:hypothetical protein
MDLGLRRKGLHMQEQLHKIVIAMLFCLNSHIVLRRTLQMLNLTYTVSIYKYCAVLCKEFEYPQVLVCLEES